MSLNILITGGAGYIGSHTALALLQADHNVVVIDNLCNSSHESLVRVEKIVGRAPVFILGDISNSTLVRETLINYKIDAVMHFAGLKSVSESIQKPLDYYNSNVSGSIQLLRAMQSAGVYRLVFSSSATVYGEHSHMPLSEASSLGKPTNSYGWSKWMIEQCLKDLSQADSRWRIAVLRYFNPGGAHPSGLMGEDPRGTPNNLLPYIAQVATGQRRSLRIYGGDYPTPDGTGIRDYIHVLDLAQGHLCALQILEKIEGLDIWNLGTGYGTSVLQAIHAFEEACQRPIPYEVVARRVGDVAECWTTPTKAQVELGWHAQRGISEIMADAWRWQSRNPDGYGIQSQRSDEV